MHSLPSLSAAPDAPIPLRSLNNNALCGIQYGEGTYTAEGIIKIAEMLKVNTTLQSIRCASRAHFLTDCQ